jgi:NADH-quinone oxidoreductase subunit F
MTQQVFRILRHREIENLDQLDVYLQHGGFETFKKVVTTLTPKQVIDIVKESGLRGRGGAGFPTGVKWGFLTPNKFPRYVVCNSDESEPGTFKDREILEKNPFQFLEGLAIAAYAAEANTAYNYSRGEFWTLSHKLEEKIAELMDRGLLGDNLFGTSYSLRIFCHLGAGAYICGEESALLESLEGRRGQPRLKPPFPADTGLYGKPTIVNNTETLTNVPLILQHGAAWYKQVGTEKSAGTKIVCVSGHVEKPGNYEVPLGTTFRQVIFDLAGGVRGGKKLKAILPSGASAPILAATDEVLDTPLTYEDVRLRGSELGSASVILMDEDTDMSWVAYKTTQFFKHESCGKCTPCREGTFWMLNVLKRIESDKGAKADVQMLQTVASQIQGKCLCPLGEFSTSAVVSSLKLFNADYQKHVK